MHYRHSIRFTQYFSHIYLISFIYLIYPHISHIYLIYISYTHIYLIYISHIPVWSIIDVLEEISRCCATPICNWLQHALSTLHTFYSILITHISHTRITHTCPLNTHYQYSIQTHLIYVPHQHFRCTYVMGWLWLVGSIKL